MTSTWIRPRLASKWWFQDTRTSRKIETEEGPVHYLNPGSAGPRRFRLPITLAMIDVAATGMRPSIHTLVA